MSNPSPPTLTPTKRRLSPWIFDLLLLYVLVAGAFFRFSGIFWGENQYLHPDERFLVWVGTDISPVHSLGDYFNTPKSSLNPHNVGHGFYVYGTFPMFITRYAVEWIFGHSGFDVMTQVGRVLSAVMDLVTVVLVYLAAERLYHKRVAILAAAFSAAAVLQIQQSHFFTMDTFMNAFMFLAFYFAVRIATIPNAAFPSDPEQPETAALQQKDEPLQPSIKSPAQPIMRLRRFVRNPLFFPGLGFGLALGMAAASKLDAAPMAIALPAALLLLFSKIPSRQRYRFGIQAFVVLFLAALVSLFVFRILQPYAFRGPGILGILPNSQWVNNIRELVNQGSGDVDFPPAMQWARRSRWFSFQNLVLWGLGLPYGLLAWFGFGWVGWRILTDYKRRHQEWINHVLIWGWTVIYFVWQSMRLNSTMRYQLPIYPMLAILAGWAIVALYDYGKNTGVLTGTKPIRLSKWARPAALLVGGAVLLATFGYAYAFSRIYTRPITRIEASRWIYQNIPGPINLVIQTDHGLVNQPVPFPYNQSISPGVPYSYTFQPKTTGRLERIFLPRVEDQAGNNQPRVLTFSLYDTASPDDKLADGTITKDLSPDAGDDENSLAFILNRPVDLDAELTYRLQFEIPGQVSAVAMDGPVNLTIQPAETATTIQPLHLPVQAQAAIVRPDAPFTSNFTAPLDGYLTQLTLGGLSSQQGEFDPQELRLSLQNVNKPRESQTSQLQLLETVEERSYRFMVSQPLPVAIGESYLLSVELWPKGGKILLSGSPVANEGEWDDGLPLRLDGADGFGGIFPLNLDFNMYWDDNPEKLERFLRILDQTDYILISSNRQWGTLPRIPERFPLTTLYYRNLLGCPDELEIVYCYRVALPGMFTGALGFELIQTFQSDVTLGPIRINDQFAEEAFTVYDHPKVLIFKKTGGYDSADVGEILGTVDFTKIIRMPPMRYPSNPSDLMLPTSRWTEQQRGGTWSDLFKSNAIHNRFQPLGVLVWYLSVALLGLVCYPGLRLAFPGLDDGGYPLARTAGMLILSYLVWLAGSFRISFTRPVISVIFILMLLLGGLFAYRQRRVLLRELRERGRYFLLIEVLMLGFFLAFLLVRVGNPDLWHQWKGGEKPMDFSYFNAVLKSTSFPPYDPWYAGGYLNYYYYGFVFAGVLTKWLGIVPAFAYNLILPTLFSLIAMSAFSIAWNLAASIRVKASDDETGAKAINKGFLQSGKVIPAFAAAIGMAVLGNLGTVRMIFQGFQKISAPNGSIEGANLITQWTWALQGFFKTLQGTHIPYSLGDWYWLPSRIIPAPGEIEPITEFPYFSVLYGDPHAHLFAMPIALLGLGGIIAIVLGQGRGRGWGGSLMAFLVTGLAVGALKPTNTWDFYPYLALGIIGIGITFWNQFQFSPRMRDVLHLLADISPLWLRILRTLGSIFLFVGLAILLFQPYDHWYVLGYSKVELWKGSHTPISAFLTHWGLFLFLIISWMAWESIDWMAKTPISALRRLLPYRVHILAGLLVMLLVIIGLVWLDIRIAPLVLPLMAWAGLLLLKPDMPKAKQIVSFLIGTGLALTLTVEIIVLRGDIGRMNTVFKFYLQVWTLFSISAAASFGWLVGRLPNWSLRGRTVWQIALVMLVAGTALYPITATAAKIKDRMTDRAPHTLNGMEYMAYAVYNEQWGEMNLNQDYWAIRWLQENASASAVIVEANLRDLYRWGSRYTIYTGMPGVVGWEWHQQQQRTAVPGDWISKRIDEVADFYLTTDWEAARNFLKKYNVRYIILGQQERGKYPGEGLEKFQDAEGILWREIYHERDTIIYEVLG